MEGTGLLALIGFQQFLENFLGLETNRPEPKIHRTQRNTGSKQEASCCFSAQQCQENLAFCSFAMLVHLRVKPEHFCDELLVRDDLDEVLFCDVLLDSPKGFFCEKLFCSDDFVEKLLEIDGLLEECGLSSLDNFHFSSM